MNIRSRIANIGLSVQLGICGGVFLGFSTYVSPAMLGGLFIGVMIAGIFPRYWTIICLLISASIIGGLFRSAHWYAEYHKHTPDLYIQEELFIIQSRAKSHPRGAEYIVRSKYQDYQAIIIVIDSTLERGDVIRISGKIHLPEESRAQHYLQSQNIHGYIQVQSLAQWGRECNLWCYGWRVIDRAHQRFVLMIDQAYPGQVGDFLKGILIGNTDELSQSLQNQFRLTGISHILAISGYNISIIIVLIYQTFTRWSFSRTYAIPITLILVIQFTLLTGAEASVVRAATFASIVLTAEWFGRYVQGFRPLILVAALMSVIYPPYPSLDIGFQLSFLAVIGLMCYGKIFTTFSQGLPALTLENLLGETIAAQIMTLPLLIYYFGQISIVTLIANLCIIWLIPIYMILGLITSILYAFTSFVWITIPLEIMVSLSLSLNSWLSNLPFSTVTIPSISSYLLIGSYIFVGLVGYGIMYYRKVKPL